MDWIGLDWRDRTYCIVENFRSQGFNFHRRVSDLYHFFVGFILRRCAHSCLLCTVHLSLYCEFIDFTTIREAKIGPLKKFPLYSIYNALKYHKKLKMLEHDQRFMQTVGCPGISNPLYTPPLPAPTPPAPQALLTLNVLIFSSKRHLILHLLILIFKK